MILHFIKGVKISEPLHTEIYLVPDLLGKSVGMEFFLRVVWSSLPSHATVPLRGSSYKALKLVPEVLDLG